jgi:glycerophosphoryl diester phosphodiesterase
VALALVLVRTALVRASLDWIDPLGRPLRQQIVQVWAGEILAAGERRPGGGWSRDARRARLLSTLAEPLPDAERRRAIAALQAYREGGAAGAPPAGVPLRAAPLFDPGDDPDWPLLRPLRRDAADARALRDFLGLSADAPVNAIVLLVESFRALELQHPDIGPHVFPRSRAILDDHAIWFTQAYASAFTAGQTVRGQLSTKCSMLPNALGVAAYIGYPELRITCLPELYRRAGARTLWLNTSDAGFHNTDRFELSHGTERVHGEEFFLARGVDERIGDWGLADGPFLRSSLELLESIGAEGDSFFATLLTATSHVPFTAPPGIQLPQPLEAALGPGRNRLHRRYLAMLRYVDGALADFFERLFASTLGEHTVVVLLGDHSVGLNPYLDLTPIQKTEMRFRIPLAIVSKGLRRPVRVNQPVHQIDVAPALARIAGLTGEVAWLGRDPLAGAGSPWVYLEGERLHYRDGERACYTLRGESAMRCLALEPGEDPLFSRDPRSAEPRQAEAAFFRQVAHAAGQAIRYDLLEPPAPDWEERFRALQADVRPGEAAPQIWAHRGFHAGGAPENSPQAVAAAAELGFPGVELDVFFVAPDRIVVQHDEPTPEELETGVLHTLDEHLALLPANAGLYLDFKNLSRHNAAAVASQLGPLLRRHGALQRTFVESTHWDALAALRRHLAGVRILYWVEGYKDLDEAGRRRVRRTTARSGTGAVSIDHRQIDDAFLRDFAHLRIHAWTVNRAARARELAARGVIVILTDEDLSGELPELMH